MDGETVGKFEAAIRAAEAAIRAAGEFYVAGGFTPWSFMPYYLAALVFWRLPTILRHFAETSAARRQFKLDGRKLSSKISQERLKRERKRQKGKQK